MTHSEFHRILIADIGDLEPTDCVGELPEEGDLTNNADGEWILQIVCPKCGRIIVWNRSTNQIHEIIDIPVAS